MMVDYREEKTALAAALRLAERFGFSEGVCNHFSLQVSDDTFLLSPHGIHWSMIRPQDILSLSANATQDSDAELTAFCIHGAIHRQHDRARCVLHTHMPNTTALTCLKDPLLRYISQNSLRFYDDVAYDDAYNGLAETMDEGDRIAATLGDKGVLFLGNHGVIVTGSTVADAFDRLYYLERAAELQILAMSTGKPLSEIPDSVARNTRAEFDAGGAYAEAHFNALLALLEQHSPGWSC
ncbi:MAG: hypothetical protein CMQ05_01210 [Gammaproteobacteria bacterium]|nr:hypothetical protein [Gammaproteobacteria bacterium]RPG25705.1 MAG: hypothetical protein CBC10_007175 [Gammaproteobacteria bacterium TMED50]